MALNRRVEIEVVYQKDDREIKETVTVRKKYQAEKKLRPVLFYAALDYGDAVDHALLEIHGPERSDKPLRSLTLTAQALDQPIAWDLRDEQGRLVKAANGYYYLLKNLRPRGSF